MADDTGTGESPPPARRSRRISDRQERMIENTVQPGSAEEAILAIPRKRPSGRRRRSDNPRKRASGRRKRLSRARPGAKRGRPRKLPLPSEDELEPEQAAESDEELEPQGKHPKLTVERSAPDGEVPYEFLAQLHNAGAAAEEAVEDAESSHQGSSEDFDQYTFVRFPRNHLDLPRVDPDSEDEAEGILPSIEKQYPEELITGGASTSASNQPDGADEESLEAANSGIIEQKIHARISEHVRDIVLGPDLSYQLDFHAIAPVGQVKKDHLQWHELPQVYQYGLHTDIALDVLPVSDVRVAYQSLTSVLKKGSYNRAIASDVSSCWEETERFPAHMIDEEDQQLRVITVLLKGWQRIGLVEKSDQWTARNVQQWLPQVAVNSDLLEHRKYLGAAESNNWLIKRFLVAAQACGLLPKCSWIRHDNAQDWLHLFVPIHDPSIAVPPGTKYIEYWNWHQNITRQYWQRCGIVNEAELTFNKLWNVYRPRCTPYLYLDHANIVSPDSKPDEVPSTYFEMAITRNRKQKEKAREAQGQLPRQGGPVVGDNGRITSGNLSNHPLDFYLGDGSDSDESMPDSEIGGSNDDDNDDQGDDLGNNRPQGTTNQAPKPKSSVDRFIEAARGLRESSQVPQGRKPSFPGDPNNQVAGEQWAAPAGSSPQPQPQTTSSAPLPCSPSQRFYAPRQSSPEFSAESIPFDNSTSVNNSPATASSSNTSSKATPKPAMYPQDKPDRPRRGPGRPRRSLADPNNGSANSPSEQLTTTTSHVSNRRQSIAATIRDREGLQPHDFSQARSSQRAASIPWNNPMVVADPNTGLDPMRRRGYPPGYVRPSEQARMDEQRMTNYSFTDFMFQPTRNGTPRSAPREHQGNQNPFDVLGENLSSSSTLMQPFSPQPRMDYPTPPMQRPNYQSGYGGRMPQPHMLPNNNNFGGRANTAIGMGGNFGYNALPQRRDSEFDLNNIGFDAPLGDPDNARSRGLDQSTNNHNTGAQAAQHVRSVPEMLQLVTDPATGRATLARAGGGPNQGMSSPRARRPNQNPQDFQEYVRGVPVWDDRALAATAARRAAAPPPVDVEEPQAQLQGAAADNDIPWYEYIQWPEKEDDYQNSDERGNNNDGTNNDDGTSSAATASDATAAGPVETDNHNAAITSASAAAGPIQPQGPNYIVLANGEVLDLSAIPDANFDLNSALYPNGADDVNRNNNNAAANYVALPDLQNDDLDNCPVWNQLMAVPVYGGNWWPTAEFQTMDPVAATRGANFLTPAVINNLHDSVDQLMSGFQTDDGYSFELAIATTPLERAELKRSRFRRCWETLAVSLIGTSVFCQRIVENEIAALPGSDKEVDLRPIYFIVGRDTIVQADPDGKACRKMARWGYFQDKVGWMCCDKCEVWCGPYPHNIRLVDMKDFSDHHGIEQMYEQRFPVEGEEEDGQHQQGGDHDGEAVDANAADDNVNMDL
ncbi:hypothetical protein PG995_003259 [Apiospora arundinis]